MKPIVIRIVALGVAVGALTGALAPIALAGLTRNRCETFVRDGRKPDDRK